MPGLVGLCDPRLAAPEAADAVGRMAKLVTHPRYNVADEVVLEGTVAATRVAVDVVRGAAQPARGEGVSVWFDGDVANGDELRAVTGAGSAGARDASAGRSGAALLLALYLHDPGMGWLDRVDGVWAAVVSDAPRGRMHLLVDRLGMRQLFWHRSPERVAWTSSLSAFLALPGFTPVVDTRALEEYFAVGHPLGDRTLLEGVDLVPPGTVLTVDTATSEVTARRYWWWDRIEPRQAPPDEREIHDELARLLRRAVEARYPAGERVGVSLSGGLDSRAIVAAAPEERPPLPAVTFGYRGCMDVRIARAVCAVNGAPHRTVELTEDNWWAPRVDYVWYTDGQFNLMNMHGVEGADVFRDTFDVSLDGLGGDIIPGGMYLSSFADPERFDPEGLARWMKCSRAILGDLSRFEALGSGDFYLLENRARRLNNAGTRHMQVFMDDRKPFLANELVDFTLGLPARLRLGGGLYQRALRRAFPAYFERLPWQKTMLPAGAPAWAVGAARWVRRGESKLLGVVHAPGVPGWGPWWYTDYDRWLRLDVNRRRVDALLRDPDALFLEFPVAREGLAVWDAQLRGEKKRTQVGRLLTFEIWLRQFFDGSLRPEQASRAAK